MNTSSPLRLYLFGRFRLERDEQPIDLPTRKAASLLAYLALHPELHAREKIATLFWGDSSEEHARRSLRTALAALRKELGNDLLLTDRETVQLNPDFLLWVDAKEFQILDFKFQIGELDQSEIFNLKSKIDLYQGDLLSDFADEWITSERERYRALYLDTLLRRAQQLRAQGEYQTAIETARKVLATDVANERAHQQLMWCYFALGERDAALKQYAECQRTLRAEMDVEPSPETVALYQRIQQTPIPRPSVETANTNLPIALTSFIGRTRELAEVKRLLDPSGFQNPKGLPVRLLTLTGAGGCGKTRLAIQVATDLVAHFADGVRWVELAAVSDALLVPHVVRKVLGISEMPSMAVLDQLITYLRAKQLLLVLDNCEHLVLACAQLAETILSYCPNVQMLATSREALGIRGEVAWLVPSLSVPSTQFKVLSPESRQPSSLSTPDSALSTPVSTQHFIQYESVRLFVERASAMRPDFTLTPANAHAVAQVCRQLDGMPLAIELAAARVKTLSVEQIAARLDDRFHLLTLGSRTALPRQQTLRATIDWSYELLSEAERELFRRLSVFAGGWTLEAAEEIAKDEGGRRKDETKVTDAIHPSSFILHPSDVLDLLTRLVDKSLLVMEYQEAETRYRMLETIREYVREKLQESGEAKRVGKCHFDYFAKIAQVAEKKLQGSDQLEWLNRLDSERHNLHAALRWSSDEDNSAARLQLAAEMWRFWLMRGEGTEGCRWLEETLARAAPLLRTTERAYALTALGCLSWMQADYLGSYARLEEGAAIYRELGDTIGFAYTLLWRSPVTSEKGDSLLARSLAEESVRLFRTTADRWGLAHSLFILGRAERYAGNDAAALLHYDESIAIFRALGDRWGIGLLLSQLGMLALHRGDPMLARSLFEERLAIGRQLRSKQYIGMSTYFLGYVAYQTGDYGEAWRLFAQSLLLSHEIGHKLGSLDSLCGLASLMSMQGQRQRAVQLFAAVGALSTAMGVRSWDFHAEYERSVASLRAQLDEATFNAAWSEGRAMTMEQAIAEALAV